ncbi:MAG: hypothetical protein GX854_09340 [Clostridiales bacterium]|nr:hypothetical protein [Clostridiales bacterium]
MKHLLRELLELSFSGLEEAKEILSITKDIQNHIQTEDIDSLNQALGCRQERISRVNLINAEADEKRKKLKEMFGATAFKETDKAKYHEADHIPDNEALTKELYKEIYHLEKANLKNMEDLLKKYKDSIEGVQKNKKAVNAYGRNTGIKQSVLLNHEV